MKRNMGSTDRVVRILVAAAIIALYYTHRISGTVAVAFLIVSGIFILTSAFSFCPLYFPFGINTKKKKNNEQLSTNKTK